MAEGFECGIGNAECGIKGRKLKTHMKDRGQITDDRGFRMGNWECGMRKEK
jgi:hypothetical protein